MFVDDGMKRSSVLYLRVVGVDGILGDPNCIRIRARTWDGEGVSSELRARVRARACCSGVSAGLGVVVGGCGVAGAEEGPRTLFRIEAVDSGRLSVVGVGRDVRPADDMLAGSSLTQRISNGRWLEGCKPKSNDCWLGNGEINYEGGVGREGGSTSRGWDTTWSGMKRETALELVRACYFKGPE